MPMHTRKQCKRRILAVSSGGGHWVQLLRLRPAFEQCEVSFVTVNRSYRSDTNGSRFYSVVDGTAWTKGRLLLMAAQIMFIMVRERPDVVVSTGAAPGYFALRFGKLLGARTVWIDSVANIEKLSLSGQHAGRYADLWLTQWPHLAGPDGPHFIGGVL